MCLQEQYDSFKAESEQALMDSSQRRQDLEKRLSDAEATAGEARRATTAAQEAMQAQQQQALREKSTVQVGLLHWLEAWHHIRHTAFCASL